MQIIGLPSTNRLDRVDKGGSIPTMKAESVKLDSKTLGFVRKLAKQESRTVAAQLKLLVSIGLKVYRRLDIKEKS